MEELKNYYNEHAAQARQHENQRERMTNIILSICGVLIGLATFGELSIWTLTASISIIILGCFGFAFAGKHYERTKFHNAIMSEIRKEIDKISIDKNAKRKSLSAIRKAGAKKHYSKFVWINIFTRNRKKKQANLKHKSIIARFRVHHFWESLHLIIIILGMCLTLAIIVKAFSESKKKPIEIKILKDNE